MSKEKRGKAPLPRNPFRPSQAKEHVGKPDAFVGRGEAVRMPASSPLPRVPRFAFQSLKVVKPAPTRRTH